MSSSLSPELEQTVADENARLEKVLHSLRAQFSHSAERHAVENDRARTLTSDLVAARRAEDKAMLASDEAVSHALKDKQRGDLKVLDRLVEKPYFARLVVEESGRSMEYLIGMSANPDCRIIDWRKAPISKLYYEYKEGDEYNEEIQGRERNGTVVVRNSLEIKKSKLLRVVCRHGVAVQSPEGWVALGHSRAEQSERSYSGLPSVTSLITPEQFRTITENAESAVLIQGIAGSGKTTVALHRLAWLLHEDNAGLKPEECLIIALSNALKQYTINSLRALEISVPVLTFEEWAALSIVRAFPRFVHDGKIRRAASTPSTIDRVKRSLAVLTTLEEMYESLANTGTPPGPEAILRVLGQPQRILASDESKLLSKEQLMEAYRHTEANLKEDILDHADDALLLRLVQLERGGSFLDPKSPDTVLLKHLMVDEVQEFGPTELACIISGVEQLHQLTLVGDIAQRMGGGGSFPGWEKLQKHWDQANTLSHFVSLTVSHRSTAEIMRLADAVQKRPSSPATRHGRIPIWFHAKSETKGIRAAIDWLNRAVEKYPQAVTAVLCRDPQEAKQVLSFLEPSFRSAVRLGDSHSFSFDEGIIVTDVRQVKGLEFMNVLLWNPTFKSYPSTEENRNALYVAMTRAEENLCIATWQRPSALLPQVRSPLVRGYELDLEEEEAE